MIIKRRGCVWYIIQIYLIHFIRFVQGLDMWWHNGSRHREIIHAYDVFIGSYGMPGY